MDAQYLVFDLETVGFPLKEFHDSQQEYLLRGALTDEEQQKKISEFALSPLTGKIVCIGMQMMQQVEGVWNAKKVAYCLDETVTEDGAHSSIELSTGDACHLSNEKTMLENFWKLLAVNRTVTLVSFNGRNFDAPWLMLRSAVLGIRPTRNLMDGTRFNYSNHIDLIDKLTFFSGSSSGATRRFNFDFFARAFGVTSPKSAGVDGSKVGELYNQGEINTIAEYCLRDVTATWDLFLKWDEFLRF